MKNINKYITFGAMILAFIFCVTVVMPSRAQAFQVGQLIDPFCWFACDDNNPAPAPANNQTPNPIITISASPINVNYNGSSTITWNSSNATSCSASGGTNGWSGSKNISGSFYTGALTQTTTFGITCSNNARSVNNSITVNVSNQQVQNPTVFISASPTSINYNEPSTITWNSNNATSCSASGGVNGWSGNRNTSGSFSTGALTSSTTFYIACTNSTGQQASASATVYVNAQVQNPTVTIYASPTNVSYNGSSTITWNSNNATSCSASGGVNSWSGSRNTSGTFYTGALTGATTFYITCNNSTGSDNASTTVNVDNQVQYQYPTVSLSASPSSIQSGQGSNLYWSSSYATSCYASWTGNTATSGSALVYPSYTTTYTITCYGYNGQQTSASTAVYVSNNYYNNNYQQSYVTTSNANNITSSSATLNGYVTGNSSYPTAYTTAWFVYGTNTNFGYTTTQNSYSYGYSNFSNIISGLLPNTTYYFQAVAQTSQGIVYGSTMSFTTTNNYIYNQPASNQPTVVVYANQTSVSYGGTSTVSWLATNATSCLASGGSDGWAGAKNASSGSFLAGPLKASATFAMTCSNSFGSASDSETITVRGQTAGITTTRPTPTSSVVVNSSLDRSQAITPTIDNTRPHPGDEINYTVSYQNVGDGAATGLTLRIDLSSEVDYISSNKNNPTISNNTLLFNLGTLKANSQDAVTIRVLVRNDTPVGTNLNFPATLSYYDPSGQSQSVNANVSAQVYGVSGNENTNTSLGANAFWAGFFPANIFGWFTIIILTLLLILLGKYILRSDQPNPPLSAKKTTKTPIE